MSDLLDTDPPFDASLRGTMQRLAQTGVPRTTASLPEPVPPMGVPDGRVTDTAVAPADAPSPRRVRERALVVGAVAIVVALLGTLAALDRTADDLDTTTATFTTWRVMSPSPLDARAGSASVWTGDRWFIWGGHQASPVGVEYFADGALYDPETDRWQVIAPAPLGKSTLPDAVLVGGEIIVGGGSTDTQESADAALAAYDPATDRWRVLPDAPGPIVHLQLIDETPTATVVVGEMTALSRLDMATSAWSEPVSTDLSVGPEPSFEARARFATHGTDRYQASFYRLHKNQLEQVEYELSEVMQFPAAVATDDEVIVVGQGAASDDRDDTRTVARYDVDTGETRTFEANRSDPGLATLASTETAVVLMPNWSGQTGIELFDLSTNRWVDIEEPPVDVRRRQPVTVSTGDRFLLWGGETLSTGSPEVGPLPENTGAILTIESSFPAELTDEWREIASSPLSPREGHSAVWTGTEMIIWGGDRIEGSCSEEEAAEDSSCGGSISATDSGLNRVPPGQQNDGAAYDPATDTWRTIAEAPIQPRSLHEAVWTGTEMIVWGGSNGYRPDRLGAAYDPATDTWRVLPEIRVGQAVQSLLHWDGTFMYVFAIGEDAPDHNRVGLFRYDPTADSWDDLGLVGLDTTAHITEADGQILVSGSRRATDDTTEIPVIIASADRGESWTNFHEVILKEGENLGPMIITEWRGGVLIMAESRIGDRTSDLVLALRPFGASFYSTRNGPALPDEWYHPAEATTPFAGPVLLAIDDILTFSPYGEVARGNPIDGWRTVAELDERRRSFGMSTVWADDSIIVWGGRGGWNGAGSVETGFALRPAAPT